MPDIFAALIVTAAQAQAASDAAGLTDKATLVSRGWTVTTN